MQLTILSHSMNCTMQNNNVFSDLREKFAILSQKRQAAKPGQVVQMILEQETGERSAAKAWLILFCGSMVLTAFVGWMGFNYYSQIFSETFPGSAGLMAVGLVLFIEVVKVYLAYTSLSSIVFGWFAQSGSKFFFWLFCCLLAGGVYKWSYDVSTEGMAIFVANQGAAKAAQTTLADHLNAATAAVDAQIATLNASNETAATMRTKKGRIAWSGQATITNNSATLSDLQKQRAEIVTAATAEYQNNRTAADTKTTGFARFIERFGGYAEWALLVMLVAMIFNDSSRGEDARKSTNVAEVAEQIRDRQRVTLDAEQIIAAASPSLHRTPVPPLNGHPVGKP